MKTTEQDRKEIRIQANSTLMSPRSYELWADKVIRDLLADVEELETTQVHADRDLTIKRLIEERDAALSQNPINLSTLDEERRVAQRAIEDLMEEVERADAHRITLETRIARQSKLLEDYHEKHIFLEGCNERQTVVVEAERADSAQLRGKVEDLRACNAQQYAQQTQLQKVVIDLRGDLETAKHEAKVLLEKNLVQASTIQELTVALRKEQGARVGGQFIPVVEYDKVYRERDEAQVALKNCRDEYLEANRVLIKERDEALKASKALLDALPDTEKRYRQFKAVEALRPFAWHKSTCAGIYGQETGFGRYANSQFCNCGYSAVATAYVKISEELAK